MSGQFKITYATAGIEAEELHKAYDQALEEVKKRLGERHPMYIGGEARYAAEEFEDRSPIDTRIVLGRFQKGTRKDAVDAIRAAKAAFPAWSRRPWQERVAVMRRVADLISEHRYELSAILSLEVGKSRLEALGDVEEAADLIRYYCHTMEQHSGFVRELGKLGPNEKNFSVLRPYGVWVVISPFNFPCALAAGPGGAALVAGNTVVFKPASDTPWVGQRLVELCMEAGVPAGAVNYVTGSGSDVGAELVENLEVDGITFTGSYEVGFNVYRTFSRVYPRPAICEMGGKNPVIVSRKAKLEDAVEGVVRSAFGLSGQKCSATSRVYIEAPVKERFTEMLVDRTDRIKVGDPTQRDVFMGPVINESAYRRFQKAMEEARRDGKILFGGEVLGGDPFSYGYFVEPTVIDGLPKDHRLMKEELFLPVVALAEVGSLEEAMALANDSIYGLTAGFYSEDEDEIRWFLDKIEAGVVYVNRRAGATTGAWPGVQTFGGWKGSGSTGRGSGGPYYLQQYLREQSWTIIEG
jgi:1-pyrroline-5-carboxylate dehydrogenase